jgi:hypothetical protein
MGKRLFINGPQPLNRCIRIRSRLKIREKVFALAVPHSHPLDALIDLAKNTRPWQPAAGAETAIVAKRAAARCDRTVHIGASKSGIDADLLHASAKTLPEEEIA